MRSRISTWGLALFSLSLAKCAADSLASDSSRLATMQRDVSAYAACGSPNWHMLNGPRIGVGDAAARHRDSEVELEIDGSAGFEVGRASLVYSAGGNQLLVEIKNTDGRWRCGIRSYPGLAFDERGEPIAMREDAGYPVLAATGIDLATREGIAGSCLGPGETGYLQIKVTRGLAKVSLRLEATHDGQAVGPPPSCVVPQSYTYQAGQLRIQVQPAGVADPTYEPAPGSGLAMVIVMDAERLPLALFPFTAAADGALTGVVSLNDGTSQNLAVVVW